jgi:hypothetical protein
VKLRKFLKKLRMRPVDIKGEGPENNVDAIASAGSLHTTPSDAGVAPMAPTSWVPSQQDDRPRH